METAANANRSAMIASATGAILLGVSIVGLRVCVREIPSATLGFLRFAGAGSLLLLGLLVLQRARFALPREAMPRVFLGGAALFAGMPLSLHHGLESTTASRASLMMATVPLWTALVGRLNGRERLNAMQLGGAAVAVLGVAVALQDGLKSAVVSSWKGDASCLIAAICAASYGLIVQPVLARHGAITVSAWAMLAGATLLLPVAMMEGFPAQLPFPSAHTLLWLGYVVVVGGALAFAAWTMGLAGLLTTQASVFLNLNPLAANATGVMLLDEPIRAAQLTGLAMVLMGIWLLNRFRVRLPAPR